jgi:hypothetical protein
MDLWKLKGYVKDSGINVVKEWCDGASDDVWEAFVGHLSYLADQPPERWVFPWTRLLRGGKRGKKKGCSGLLELRFEVGNIPYRPIGYFSGKMEFTLLFFAIENGGEFVPPDACERAKQRKAEIDADKERAREFRL